MKRFPEPIAVEIETISPFGPGVAKLPLPSGAKALLEVPYTMPGDLALVTITGKKNSIYRGELAGLLKPSERRVEPICPHFGVCGGCSWQHIPYNEQLTIKEKLLARLFERELQHTSILPIIPCDSPYHYRNKMEFTYSDGALGLVNGPVDQCFLCSPWVSQAINLFIGEPNISKVIFRKRMVIVLGEVSDRLFTFLKQHGATSIYEGDKCLFGPSEFEEELTVCGKTFKFLISPHSFFQPNTAQAEKLFAKAIELADLKGTQVIYDLYCGVGAIGICMSPFVAQVIGIEIFEDAVAMAKKNARLNGVTRYSAFAAPVGQLKQNLPKPDVIVVDPPRGGLEGEAISFILEKAPPKLIYISCQPTTQVRDLKIFLENGYRIAAVQPLDQFPQTPHLENIAALQYK